MENLLYHYTSQNALLGIIENGVIWASNIHYLNDSKEFVHAFDEIETLINQRKKNDEVLDRVYEGILARLRTIERIHIFVASLTERGDQLSQWRGYCANGAGYSIGFSKAALEKLARINHFTFKPCIYDQQEQRQILAMQLGRAETIVSTTAHSSGVVEDAIDQFIDEFVQIAPLLKHHAFMEEQEWRLISGLVASTDERWRTRPGKSTLIPYIEFDIKAEDGSLPVKNVIVGPGPEKSLAINALPAFLAKNGVKEWSITPSQVPYRTT